MAADLSQQNNLDAYLKVTLQMEFFRRLKKLKNNGNATEVSADHSMLFNNFRKNEQNTATIL